VGWIKNIFGELFGLFVDDGRFALSILVWLGVVRLVLPKLGIMENARGIVLFMGLGIILIESTIRYSRGKQLGAGK
jgi:hypothetical protein